MGSPNQENIVIGKIPLCTFCSIAIFIVGFLIFNDKLVFEDQVFITEKHFDNPRTNLTQLAEHVGSNNTSTGLPATPMFIQADKTSQTLPTSLPENSVKPRITEFYIYEGPGFDFYKDCIEWYGPNAVNSLPLNLTDRDYKHASAFKFLEGIENHYWRVKDPELAKIFVVPALLGQVIRRGRCRGKTGKNMISDLSYRLGQSKYWKRNNGLDHVLLDTDFRIEGNDRKLDPFRKFLRNMTVGHHINNPMINMNVKTGLTKSFRNNPKWACTVLVPMNEREIYPETGLNFDDFKKRPNDIFFMGQWDQRKGYNTRRQISKLFKNNKFEKATNYIYTQTNEKYKDGLKQCDFDVCLKNYTCYCKSGSTSWNLYPKLLGQSKFGLAMSGDNAGSTRYFDVPNAGAIPIFIANQAFTEALPFISKVPWRDFSFFIPETGRGDDIVTEIRSIVKSDDRILRRKYEILMKYRDELSWTRSPSRVAGNFIEEAWDRCVQPFLKNSDLYRK